MSEIRLVNLRKEFKDVVAVNDVSITFPTSSVTCLLGPSGCGKTTMMRMIAGLESTTSGEIYIDNDKVTNVPVSKRGIAMVFQYPVVYRGLNAYRNIEVPLLVDKLPPETRKDRIHNVVEILGLEDSLYKNVEELDLGTMQKVAVARAVARQSKIILFDEPITNVDAEAKIQLERALKRLSKQLNQTIVYVTHDQTEAMTLADQIVLMEDGNIIQFEDPRNLYNFPCNTFGGWFLGNPGMNFFEHSIEKLKDLSHFSSPLFSSPLEISQLGDSLNGMKKITIGIRPEKVVLSTSRKENMVPGKVMRKFIVTGGQYLVKVKIDDLIIKAKVNPSLGQQIQEKIWVECPLEWVSLFKEDGSRLKSGFTI